MMTHLESLTTTAPSSLGKISLLSTRLQATSETSLEASSLPELQQRGTFAKTCRVDFLVAMIERNTPYSLLQHLSMYEIRLNTVVHSATCLYLLDIDVQL